jgi:methylene-tetrahydromethanopterin dehydrogenase
VPPRRASAFSTAKCWTRPSACSWRRIPTRVPPSGIEGISSNDRGVPVELARCKFHSVGPLAIGSLKYKTEFGLFRAIQTSPQPALLDFTEAYAFALEELGRSKPAAS